MDGEMARERLCWNPRGAERGLMRETPRRCWVGGGEDEFIDIY